MIKLSILGRVVVWFFFVHWFSSRRQRRLRLPPPWFSLCVKKKQRRPTQKRQENQEIFAIITATIIHYKIWKKANQQVVENHTREYKEHKFLIEEKFHVIERTKKKKKMSLEGARFICLDEAGNHGNIVLAKGRKFSVGYYTSCDLPIADERAKGIHCTIECDAFGRVSVYKKKSWLHVFLF